MPASASLNVERGLLLAGFDVKGTTITGGGLQSIPPPPPTCTSRWHSGTIVEATYAGWHCQHLRRPMDVEFEVLRDV